MTQNLKDSSNGVLKHTKTIKEGSVTKQGGKIKNWKKRWCVLNEEGLHYYKSQNNIEKGSITLDSILSVEGDDKPASKKKHCFKVVTEKRKYRICATDSLDRDEWILAIKKLLTISKNQKKPTNNNINGVLKNSTGSVDISKSYDENSSTASGTPPSSNSFLDSSSSKTIHYTPTMLALKDKFSLNTFPSELNRKRDLLSLEEMESLLDSLDAQIEEETEALPIRKEILIIKNQISKLRDQEINEIQQKYQTKKLEILNEINRRTGKK